MQHAFQPIVDLHTGQPIGFEALARFPDGRGPMDVLRGLTLLGPEALRVFDRESVASAVAAAKAFLPPDTPLFLNLTAATVAAVLDGEPLPDTAGLPVVWELVENEATFRLLSHPGALGSLTTSAAIALDDVGEGSADLRRLAMGFRDGVRWIKIARSLIHGCADDPGKQAVLRLVVRLGVAAIAEGVERPEDLCALEEIGIRFVQGYATGRPQIVHVGSLR